MRSFSEKEDDQSSLDDPDSIYMPMADVFKTVDTTDNTKGILKTAESFEIVENPQLHQDRKVRFVDDDNPDSYTSSEANSSDSDGERNIQPILEIQETRILHNTDHLLAPPRAHPNLNDSFERMFISNKGFMSSVEESEENIDSLFLDICDSLKDQNLRTDLEYEVMDSSLEESIDIPPHHQSSEDIYETFDFLKGGDNSSDDKETIKQNDEDHAPIEDSFSSNQQNVCENDKDSRNTAKQPRQLSDQDVKGDNQFTVSDVLFLTKVVHTQVCLVYW